MDKLLTVVIPAYNIEKYEEQCLSSFVKPKALPEIEVLVVNDGSSDRTVEIAEKYVQKYPDIFRVINKENGGHGSTINRGIEEARGTYFKVVDGDDWVDGAAFGKLVRFLHTAKSDFIVNRYYWVHNQTGEKKLEFESPFPGVSYGREYAFSEVSGKTFLKMHALTIKTELLRKITRIDQHWSYVDMDYVLFPIPYVRTVTFLEEVVYQYRIGLAGQSMDMKSMQKNEVNYTRVLDRLLAYYEEQQRRKIPVYCLTYLENSLGRMAATRFKIFLSFPYDRSIPGRMKAFDRNLKERYPRIYAAVINKPVLLLRKSGYLLYPAAHLAFYWKERIKK